MTIDDVLRQFRSTGQTQVGYDRARCRKDLISAIIGLLLLVAVCAVCVYTTSLMAEATREDGPGWAVPAMVGLLVLFAVPVGLMLWTIILVRERMNAESPAPGLLLSRQGVSVGTALARPKTPVPWNAIDSITLQQRGSGQPVVTLMTAARPVYVPRSMQYDPQELHYLLENARLVATGGQQA
ncbi:hypothetical protein [Ruania zhangjianzhongii]|uniref:hypothetical protein n=1 Tax=Ruania zhangjianzhongii TaxID=2603206 RepID=UPI0011CAB9C4|nr:hypothetical protein [Ruania zhangjianzhongii]